MASGEKLAQAERVGKSIGALFLETDVPVLVLDDAGHFITANRAAVESYGYSLEELLEMRVHDVSEGKTLDADLVRASRDPHGPLSRRPHRRKDGSRMWVVPHAGPVVVDGVVYCVSVITDVTAMHDAEAHAHTATENALRDRQIVLGATLDMLRERDVKPALAVLARAFTQAVGERASLWLPETDGAPMLRMAASHGLREEEERMLAEVRLDWTRECFSARARTTRSAQVLVAHEALEGGVERMLGSRCIVSPLLGRARAHGLVYAHDTGNTDIERAMALATTLGGLGGMILEAVQLEHRAEAVWEAASERLTDGIALLNHELRIVRVNSTDAAMNAFGADALGKKCSEVFSICVGQTPCPHEVARAERLHLVREVQGRDHPLRIEIIPASSGAGEIAVIHVAHDLTDERAMRTRLLTADRLATIGRLSAGVAHEINNPAAFVSVNLGVLRDRFLAGSAQKSEVLSILDDSLNGMDRIREIVRDLKGFARERSRDVVDLSQVALSAIRIAAHETRGRARVDRLLGDEVLAHVRGARLAQCVLNLIVNAAQALPGGGQREHRIEVRTYRIGERARLEVTDTGPGVPEALKHRIFEPFFTTREASGGTGLGLWLARGIVEEEDGTLVVEDAPGGGARFIIDLPAQHAEATVEPSHATR